MRITRKTPAKKIQQRQAEIRNQVFGEIDPTKIWHRKTHHGFSTIPRAMPLIGSIMDILAGKGKPVATTYLEIWCRSNDEGFVTLSKPSEIAFASGFGGQRGVSTWKERLRLLEKLGFITTKPGVSGSIHYVQIWNPYRVIKHHRNAGTEGFPEDRYFALLERAAEIGAADLNDTDE